jgi:hypothetical protein
MLCLASLALGIAIGAAAIGLPSLAVGTYVWLQARRRLRAAASRYVPSGQPTIYDLDMGHWWQQPDGSLRSGYELGRDCPRARMRECDPLNRRDGHGERSLLG